MTLNDIADYLKPAKNVDNGKCEPGCQECQVFDCMHLLSLVQDLVTDETRKAVSRERRKQKTKVKK